MRRILLVMLGLVLVPVGAVACGDRSEGTAPGGHVVDRTDLRSVAMAVGSAMYDGHMGDIVTYISSPTAKQRLAAFASASNGGAFRVDDLGIASITMDGGVAIVQYRGTFCSPSSFAAATVGGGGTTTSTGPPRCVTVTEDSTWSKRFTLHFHRSTTSEWEFGPA